MDEGFVLNCSVWQTMQPMDSNSLWPLTIEVLPPGTVVRGPAARAGA